MRYIFHIDANSAYLSWTAANLLSKGYPVDLRDIPSVIAGDPDNRHGIILAKSIPAKKYNIFTGESLMESLKKCPELVIMPPEHDLYMACSNSMYDILREYSPVVQRFSVDECFLDFSASADCFGDPEACAYEIKDRIKNELGFTVNIGVGPNKVLAKMASEFEKPDKVHTLWHHEIPTKMWPLPVRELFMVGRATKSKLEKVNIKTIGDLAHADPHYIRSLLKKHGTLVWNYANGRDEEPVVVNDQIERKSISHATTTPYDVQTRQEAQKILLALTERTCQKLRKLEFKTSLVFVTLKTNEFYSFSHQLKLPGYTSSTKEIFQCVMKLFDQMWTKVPLRLLGIGLGDLTKEAEEQLSLFDKESRKKEDALDQVIDHIREKYGEEAVVRGCFANSSDKPLLGGVNKGRYLSVGGRE